VSTRQSGPRTSAPPMSGLQVSPLPSKRDCCIFRAASTRCRIVFEGFPRRSSESLSSGLLGYGAASTRGTSMCNVACSFATGWRSINGPRPALPALS